MCSSSVVELPFPKIANNCSHHISAGTFTISWGVVRPYEGGEHLEVCLESVGY